MRTDVHRSALFLTLALVGAPGCDVAEYPVPDEAQGYYELVSCDGTPLPIPHGDPVACSQTSILGGDSAGELASGCICLKDGEYTLSLIHHILCRDESGDVVERGIAGSGSHGSYTGTRDGIHLVARHSVGDSAETVEKDLGDATLVGDELRLTVDAARQDPSLGPSLYTFERTPVAQATSTGLDDPMCRVYCKDVD